MLNVTVLGSKHWYYNVEFAHIGVIQSQHWYNNEAFLSKLSKKRQKNSFFFEMKTRSFNVKCLSLVTNDSINILMKAVTCTTVL